MKQEIIIVYGVDVSECKHFKNGTCLADYLLTDMDFNEAKCGQVIPSEIKEIIQECEVK